MTYLLKTRIINKPDVIDIEDDNRHFDSEK